MALYKVDVGLIVYHEVTIEAEDSETAKIKLEQSVEDIKNDKGMTEKIEGIDDVVWNMNHKSISWSGIKPNTFIKISEEVIE